MLNKLKYSFLYFLALVFLSCETDFEVLTEYREVPVIYGFLDTDSSNQYLKVTKAFQNTDNDAVVLAKNRDSSEYDDGEIRLQLFNLGNNSLVGEYTRTSIVNKDDGLFYAPEQTVYVLSGVNLNSNTEYEVRFENLRTGKTARARTRTVGDFEVTEPNFQFSGLLGIDFGLSEKDFIISNAAANNAEVFDLDIIIRYRTIVNGALESEDSVIWEATRANLESSFTINAVGFYNQLVQNIDYQNDDPNTIRKLDTVTCIVKAANADFEDYFFIQNNYSPVNQIRPVFTNVENGLGLFCGRNSESADFKVNENPTLTRLVEDYGPNNQFGNPNLKFVK